MIKADFYKSKKDKNLFCGFRIEGHSGYAECGSDIVCASVSSMVLLFINLINDFGVSFDFDSQEENALVTFEVKKADKDVSKAILTLCNCIEAVSEEYPEFVKVTKQ